MPTTMLAVTTAVVCWVTDSQESGRGHDSENISDFDLFDTYLPQYKLALDRLDGPKQYNGETHQWKN